MLRCTTHFCCCEGGNIATFVAEGKDGLTTTQNVRPWKETAMQLQMRLNILVMLASFALVGAIVLGMI